MTQEDKLTPVLHALKRCVEANRKAVLMYQRYGILQQEGFDWEHFDSLLGSATYGEYILAKNTHIEIPD